MSKGYCRSANFWELVRSEKIWEITELQYSFAFYIKKDDSDF